MLGLFTELRGHQLLVVGWTKFTASHCQKDLQRSLWGHRNGTFQAILASVERL